jgi:hypothetical protein
MKRVIALILVVGLFAPACATTGRARYQKQPAPGETEPNQSMRERELLTEFARQVPAGSRVRVSDANRRVTRGTLIKTTDTSVVVQPRGRVPEPIVEVPFASLVSLELEQGQPNGGGVGRAIAIGAGAGAAAALGVLFILVLALD